MNRFALKATFGGLNNNANTLDAALDIFLIDCDRLFASIPRANKTTIRMVRKLGFIQTRTEDGNALFVMTRQPRKRCPVDLNSRLMPTPVATN